MPGVLGPLCTGRGVCGRSLKAVAVRTAAKSFKKEVDSDPSVSDVSVTDVAIRKTKQVATIILSEAVSLSPCLAQRGERL